jgi:DNA-directed RNA polymerase specialized sigma24 family protein
LRRLRDDRIREVAIRRMQGFTVAEIAEQMRISTRTVQRKLRLIEEQWLEEVTL